MLNLTPRDGNIRYYEFDNDEFWPLSEYKSSEPQRGLAFMPKRGLSVRPCMTTTISFD
jgi:coronin-1B/1C/6